MQPTISKDLEQIPGIGKKIAQALRSIGIVSVDNLKGRKAECLYQRLCDLKTSKVDRCILYVFRCAIYYVENSRHDPELLKWWNWKDNS